jgi:DNA-binding CsgD family transcriptional regulator
MINQEVTTFYAAYRKSDMGHYLDVNDDVLKAAGVASVSDIVGLKDDDLAWHKMASFYAENEKRVFETRKTHVFYEPCLYAGKPQLYRATKAPIFGRSGKIIGINAVSVLVSERCLIRLTKQQTACLKYLGMGYTHKQIGTQLGLSQKTVEHYLEAVKLKLNCKTRAELIQQAIERGLVGIF